METLASLYPPLSERSALPAYYTPACFTLALLPFLIQNKPLAITLSFPLLLYISFSWPCFTTGDASSDYYNNSHFIAMPLWYLDFVICTPRDGDQAPEFFGSHKGGKVSRGSGQRWRDLGSTLQRFTWAVRLMLPAQRGIGWNWQVKGVPPDRDANLSKWQYVRRKLFWTLFYYLQSLLALMALGFGRNLREHFASEQRIQNVIANAIIGWAGAIWVWDRLNCAYSMAAALGVTIGATGTWEWPPLMGDLAEAWSVRQMWSSTYHQACRRLLSQPAKRIVHFLGLPKGSLTSSYTQLFISFGISCLFHQAQMFNVTREDMGELSFFMSQPLAIVFEDLAYWSWRRCSMSSRQPHFEKTVGYMWTFAWFSFSLQFYIGGLVQAGVVKDWLLGYEPPNFGANVGRELLIRV